MDCGCRNRTSASRSGSMAWSSPAGGGWPLPAGCRRTPLVVRPGKGEAGVVPAEAEAGADGQIHACASPDVGDVVEVALGVGLVQVDRRWDEVVADRQD